MSTDQETEKQRINNWLWRTALTTAESVLTRHARIKDPVARHLMLADKLCWGIDFTTAAIKAFADEEHIDTELVLKAEQLIRKLQEEINLLMDWIQSPVYSPDHPYGHTMMEAAVDNAATLAEK